MKSRAPITSPGVTRAVSPSTHPGWMVNPALSSQAIEPSGETGQIGKVVGTTGVAVAIVSFNARDHLRACLDSVLADGPDEVVVVDNASTDGTAPMVRLEYPQVALCANSTNRGYAAAANQALASCRSGYVLLLNSDTMLSPGTIQTLASYMDRHPEAAVVGPMLRRPNGSAEPSCFPLPGTLAWLLENEPFVWLLRCLPIGRSRFLCLSPPTVPRVVPWVKGAAVLLRRTAFEAVGGFDEAYFMYFEEVDLCLRLRTAKAQVHFTPAATVLHVGAVSTSQRRREMRIEHFRSAVRFYRRHYSRRWSYFWVSVMRVKMLMRLARDSARLLVETDEHTRAVLSEEIAAWKTALRGLPDPPNPQAADESGR
jgi:N-acetylglucosaminyl-diphospho-decaprenol L-rhamnosyltransferase